MHFGFSLAWLVLGLLAAGGCAAGPNVVTGSDPAANFSAFRTFAFSGITDRGHEVGASDHSSLRGRLKEMIREQFAAKGLRQVSMDEGPDLLVHLFFGVKDLDRVQSTATTPGVSSSQAKVFAYDQGSWVPVPARHVATYEDHEGMLIVDLAESSDKKLVWRAIIRAVLDNNLEKNFELAHRGIAKAFEDYPSAK